MPPPTVTQKQRKTGELNDHVLYDIPNEFCERYGFKKVESALADVIVDWDEYLVDNFCIRALQKKMSIRIPGKKVLDMHWSMHRQRCFDLFLPSTIKW